MAGSEGHRVEGIAAILLPRLHHLRSSQHQLPIVLTETTHPKRMPMEQLAEAFRGAGMEVRCALGGVAEAVEMAAQLAGPKGVVVATGSMFVAADAIQAAQRAGH